MPSPKMEVQWATTKLTRFVTRYLTCPVASESWRVKVKESRAISRGMRLSSKSQRTMLEMFKKSWDKQTKRTRTSDRRTSDFSYKRRKSVTFSANLKTHLRLGIKLRDQSRTWQLSPSCAKMKAIVWLWGFRTWGNGFKRKTDLPESSRKKKLW